MRRERINPRSEWQQKMAAVGFSFHSMGGKYWEESACYSFAAEEIDMLEAATADLQEICLEAVAVIIAHDWFDRLAIPKPMRPLIEASWRRGEPSLYGRFDLRYDGASPPKLLEYNADTPTSLIESSVAQWFWLEETKPAMDQFNSIHEKLIERWKIMLFEDRIAPPVYFACASESEEDYCTIEYLRDTAIQAGLNTSQIFIGDIGWQTPDNIFVDRKLDRIVTLFKLYPWEWLVREEFGCYLLLNKIHMIEPCWKMLLSNKGILPVLWELYPGHPNLLPAYFESSKLGREYVKKPLLSREGGNIHIHALGDLFSQDAGYGKEGYVYQAYSPLPRFGLDSFPVIGSWVVGSEPAGIGVREDSTLITTNASRFVPHYFAPKE